MSLKITTKTDGKILSNDKNNFNLTPKVLDVKNIIVNNKVIDQQIKIKFYYQIDRREIKSCKHIEVRLSNFSKLHYENALKTTEKDKNDLKNNTKLPSYRHEVSLMTLKESNKKLERNYNLFKDCRIIANLDLIDKINDKKTISTSNFNNNIKSLYKLDQTAIDSRISFKRKYNDLINKRIDPAFLFQNSINKINHDKSINTKNSIKVNNYNEYVKPIFEELSNEIKNLSSYVMTKKINNTQQSNYLIKYFIVNLSLNEIKNFGESFYLFFIAKNAKKIKIQFQEYSINISKIIRQLTKIDLDHSIDASYDHLKRSKLSISKKNDNKSFIDLHCKTFNNSNFNNNFYTFLNDYNFNRRNVSITDLNPNSINSSSPNNIKISESVFYRSTINIFNKKFNNLKSCYSKGMEKNSNEPECSVIPTIGNDNNVEINLEIYTDNIKKVRIRKYKISNTSMINKNFKSFKENDEYFIRNDDSSFNKDFIEIVNTNYMFNDYHVNDYQTYVYVAECLMKDGQLKYSKVKQNSIITYKTKSNIIKIDNVVMSNSNAIKNSKNYSNKSLISKNKERLTENTIEFNVTRIENEVDKLFKILTGNLYNLFESNLKEIKNIQSLVISVQLERINHLTGEISLIDAKNVDESGKIIFIDENCPVDQNFSYKITPRIKPTTEVIESIKEKIPYLSTQMAKSNSPIRYTHGSNLALSNIKDKKIISDTRNKFNKSNYDFKKGINHNVKSQQNNDFLNIFKNDDIGDVFYIKNNLVKENLNINTLDVIVDSNITEINDINLVNLKDDQKILNLEIDVNENDADVDFYCIFIKDGNNICLHGSMHSTDTRVNKKYNYLIIQDERQSKVEYYAVPFLKNGDVLKPIFLNEISFN